jgi:ABC-type multidrug transport system permease subunit
VIWKALGVKWAFSFGALMALIAASLTTVLLKKESKRKTFY